MTIDVGTGDGRFVLRSARADPARLVIGIDPAWRRMVDSARRCARGGTTNALFVCASIEDPPAELHGIADQVLVQLPWGRLLDGVVRGDPAVCRGLRAIASTGARLLVVVGADIWHPPVPRAIAGLPCLSEAHVDSVLTARLAAHGWKVTGFDHLDGREAGAVASSWARRLAAGRAEPSFVRLTAEAIPLPVSP